MTKYSPNYRQKLYEVRELAPFYHYGYAKEVLKIAKTGRKYKPRTVYAVRRGDRCNEIILDALLIIGRRNKAEWSANKD